MQSGKRVTLSDIADAADVSVATVSMALANDPRVGPETRQRVKSISVAANYRPRRRRVVQASTEAMQVGLALVGHCGGDFVVELAQAATEMGMLTQVQTASSDDCEGAAAAIEALAERNDAVVLFGAGQQLLQRLAAEAERLVVVGCTGGDPLLARPEFHTVAADARAMGEVATRALIEAGHRRICFFCGVAPRGFWYERWRAGYLSAHAMAQLSVEPELVVAAEPGGRTGIQTAERVLAMAAPPSAYVCADPHDASQLMAALREAGRPVAEGAIVVGGNFGQLHRSGVDHLPHIAEDQKSIAAAALERLRGIHRREIIQPCSSYVPFSPTNFDKIVPPTSSD